MSLAAVKSRNGKDRMTQEQIFSAKEIGRVALKCSLCDTELVMDFADPDCSLVPRRCPACDKAYEEDLLAALDSLQRILAPLANPTDRDGDSVTFHVKTAAKESADAS